jgi:hypothetical protein
VTPTGGQWSFTPTHRSRQTGIRFTATGSAQGSLRAVYETWMDAMLVPLTGSPEQARIAWGRGSSETVSEGMGYGVTLAAAFDDQPTLERLIRYALSHLDANGLMNWKTTCSSAEASSCKVATGGTGEAPDATNDMLYGWLLACSKTRAGAWPSAANFTVPGPYGGANKSYCDLADVFGRRYMESFIDRPGTVLNSAGVYNGGQGCTTGPECTVRGGELMAGDCWQMKKGDLVGACGKNDLVFPRGIVNISYFDPGLYRALGERWGNPATCPAGGSSHYAGWCQSAELDRVIRRGHEFIHVMQTEQRTPTAADGQTPPAAPPANCSGLVFGWNDYQGACTGVPWQGSDSCKWSYDAARTAFRLARDVLWYPTVSGVENPSLALVRPMGTFFPFVKDGAWNLGPCDVGGQCSSGGVFFAGAAGGAIVAADLYGGLSRAAVCGSAGTRLERTAQEHYNYLHQDTTNADYYQSVWKLLGQLLMAGQLPKPVGVRAPEPPTPSCTDGARNGTETGVDCGGVCPACPGGSGGTTGGGGTAGSGNGTGGSGGSSALCPAGVPTIVVTSGRQANNVGTGAGCYVWSCAPGSTTPYLRNGSKWNWESSRVLALEAANASGGPAARVDVAGGASAFWASDRAYFCPSSGKLTFYAGPGAMPYAGFAFWTY